MKETLLAPHRSLHPYEPSRRVAPFLFGILKLRGADMRRRRYRCAAREPNLEDTPETSDALTTYPDQDAAIDHATMHAAVGPLSSRDREILDMLKLPEMSLREASAVWGLSVATLNAGTFRTIERLRVAPGPTAILWFTITLPALALVTLTMGPRPDLAALWLRTGFVLDEALAALTVIIAAYGAFCAGRPDEPWWKLALPSTIMLIRLGVLGRIVLVRLRPRRFAFTTAS